MMMVETRSSTIINLNHLGINKLLAEEGPNRRKLVVKLGDAKVMLEIKGKIGLEHKFSLINLDWTNKPVRVSSCGLYVISAKDVIWVTVEMTIITIIAVNLDIWQEIVKTAIIMGNLAILLMSVLSKERLSKNRAMQEYML